MRKEMGGRRDSRTDLVSAGRSLFSIAEGSSSASLNTPAFQSLYSQKTFPHIKFLLSLL